ncbi:hypothetical protein H0H93_012661 [Arthromyces matolae]|nr:hypothetical protein H0H93_012661 [Arthromyces matolae]
MTFNLLTEPLPPTIDHLISNRDQIRKQFPPKQTLRWRVSRKLFSFMDKDSDNATACFYRIYQFVILDWNIAFRNELEYFCTFHPDWAVVEIPDPADTHDPARYAALAAITHLLCDAFNRRIELGLPRDTPPIVEDWEELARRPKVLERVPPWAERVSPSPRVLCIPDAKGNIVDADDPEVCAPFKRLNLIMLQPHIHFI